MIKYKLLISIPIHERLEVVIDQILNIKHCNSDCAIVFHFSQGYQDKNSSLPKEKFLQIADKLGDVLINPVSVRTGMDDIIQAHLENFKFAKTQIDFEYFCICASNESFFKTGLYDYIKKMDGGASQDSVKGWLYEKELGDDVPFQEYLKENNISDIKYTYPEGQFFKREVFEYIFKSINDFYDYKTISVVYPRDEVYFATFLGALKTINPDLVLGKTFTYSAYHLTHLWNVTRLRIVYDISHKDWLFTAKRVDRNINDSVRAYLRQSLGYYEEEKELLKDYCDIKELSTARIDWNDFKKLILPVFKNTSSLLSRIGLKPPKKGHLS